MLQDAATIEILGGTSAASVAKDASRDFLVQKGFIKTSTPDGEVGEEIFVPPLLVGDQTSKTILTAILRQLSEAGVNINNLASKYGIVFLFMNFDAAKANVLLGSCTTLLHPPPAMGALGTECKAILGP
jgi:hypothetical protein